LPFFTMDFVVISIFYHSFPLLEIIKLLVIVSYFYENLTPIKYEHLILIET